MRSICVGFCAALLAGYAVPALAQQPVPPPPPEVTAGPPTTFFASGFDITLSPRVWFTTTVFNQPKSSTMITVPGGPAPGGGFINNCPAAQCLKLSTSHLTDVSYPLFGLSAIVAPRAWQSLERPTDFSVTVLGGSGQGTQTHLTVTTPDGGLTGTGTASRNGFEDNRVDVEAVARTALSPTTRIVYGLRTIWRQNVSDFGNNPSSISAESRATFYYPIAEAGVQLAAPITADGAHSLFAGIVGGPGYAFAHVNSPFTRLSDSAIGFLDFNIGYQYSFNQMFSAYVRYRGQVFAQTHGGPFLGQVYVIHGPEIAATLRF